MQWEELGRFFEDALVAGAGNGGPDPGALARWTTGEVVARLREQGVEDPRQSKLSPAALGELVRMVEDRSLSQSAAKEVLGELTREGGSPAAIVADRGLAPIADEDELEAIVDRAIEGNPEAVDRIRGGKAQAAGVIVGAVMKETKGRADGAEVNRLIKAKLGLE